MCFKQEEFDNLKEYIYKAAASTMSLNVHGLASYKLFLVL